jgi:hypothetical protein
MAIGASTYHDPGLNLVRDLPLPPPGFVARSASDRELRHYGLPLRPDADKHPKEAALWDRFAARPYRFVRPKLVPLHERAGSEILDYHKDKLPLDPNFADSIVRQLDAVGMAECWLAPGTSGNWSGAWVNRPSSEQLTSVSGQWVVPSVAPPLSAWNGTGFNDGTYECAVWLGLDGWNGTTDVLQAGTSSVVTVTGGVVTSTSYFAWTEWFGNLWKTETDFPVSPGEAILCMVYAPFGNSHGVALLANQTTGLSMIYGIDPPSGVTLSGNVAEWIVEDPAQASGPLFPFPNYGLTTFQYCVAHSADVTLDLTRACPIYLTDASGKVISESTFLSETSLMCNFLT